MADSAGGRWYFSSSQQYPPSTTAPWRSGRCRWTGTLVLLDQCWIEDVRARNPLTILRAIALPVDEVLPAATSPTGVHDPADGECRMTIDFQGGWRGVGWWAQRT